MMKNLFFLTIILLFSLQLSAQEVNKRENTTDSEQNFISLTKISAYPNPFSHSSKITFASNQNQKIYFEVKNILGKSVFRYSLVAQTGENEIIFQRDNLLKGMYLYTLQTDTEIISKRLVIK